MLAALQVRRAPDVLNWRAVGAVRIAPIRDLYTRTTMPVEVNASSRRLWATVLVTLAATAGPLVATGELRRAAVVGGVVVTVLPVVDRLSRRPGMERRMLFAGLAIALVLLLTAYLLIRG